MTVSLKGISASRGIAVGPAHVVEWNLPELPDSQQCEDIKTEVLRYKHAVREARAQLRRVRRRISASVRGEVGEFIDTHVMMLDDSALTGVPQDMIREQGLRAEWALKIHRDELFAVFDQMDDPYLRTRKDDLDHVVNRILRILLATELDAAGDEKGNGEMLHQGQVIVADDIAPADIALLHQQKIAGLVTEFGGPLSHTAILARNLRIPAVLGLRQARKLILEAEQVVVDGGRGIVLAGAGESIVEHYRQREREQQKAYSGLNRLKSKESRTKDGEAVTLLANIELPADADQAMAVGAAGVGLFRTEFLFMNREQLPDEDEQYQAYREVVEKFDGRPVTIRTLDVGADKQIGGGRSDHGPTPLNPALGLRAIRLCLKELPLFRSQLKAALRASAHGPVNIMVPMLSNAQEIFRVRHLIAECRRELKAKGVAMADDVPVGGMIEVPAAALSAHTFAKHLDFLSIGTNDLIQYTLAIDRIDDSVSYLYDPVHPSVLFLLENIVRAGHHQETPVSVCGEMAADPQLTRMLLGLGIRTLSMHANTMLEVKRTVLDTEISALDHWMPRLMKATNPLRIQALLRRINGEDRHH